MKVSPLCPSLMSGGATMNSRRETHVAFLPFALALAVAALVVPGPAGAARAEVEHWRHGDIARFHHEDLGRWRGGHWFHGDRLGRVGWGGGGRRAWVVYPRAVP